MSDAAKSIVVIGSGNVASHLAKGLEMAGCRILQVCSPNPDHAARLASQLKGCESVTDVAGIDRTADLYLIAVCDAAVAQIASEMPHVDGIVAHTSGSVPLDALTPASPRIAVLYPLQTFSREAEVDLPEVPFFTEANAPRVLEDIDAFGRMISEHVYHADSDRRRTLHIAGVLSCNFVNYLWDCTTDVLARDGYGFEVVGPLIKATLRKALAHGAHNSQTGPAMRRDVEVMRNHISQLPPDLASIYGTLSRAIMKKHNLDCKL